MKTTGRDFLVYLAGPISGLAFDDAQNWRDYATAQFPQEIRGISPLRCKESLRSKGIITDSYPDNPLTTDRGLTTRDRQDCTRADALLINLLGAKTVSPGTPIEFGWADAHRIPTVVVIEDEGNPYDHPMVRDLTSFRVNNLDEGIAIIEKVLLPEGRGTPRELPVDVWQGIYVLNSRNVAAGASVPEREDRMSYGECSIDSPTGKECDLFGGHIGPHSWELSQYHEHRMRSVDAGSDEKLCGDIGCGARTGSVADCTCREWGDFMRCLIHSRWVTS